MGRLDTNFPYHAYQVVYGWSRVRFPVWLRGGGEGGGFAEQQLQYEKKRKVLCKTEKSNTNKKSKILEIFILKEKNAGEKINKKKTSGTIRC